jgi:uncharacterized membrane-anchored protein
MDAGFGHIDDAIAELEFKNQFYLDEVDKLSVIREELQEEIRELNDSVDKLLEEKKRSRELTKVYAAVTGLVFSYALFYGVYFGCR